jgi:hypothetical protein
MLALLVPILVSLSVTVGGWSVDVTAVELLYFDPVTETESWVPAWAVTAQLEGCPAQYHNMPRETLTKCVVGTDLVVQAASGITLRLGACYQPPPAHIFADGFECGALRWSRVFP